MKKTILEYLEDTVEKYPEKVAFVNKEKSDTYKEFENNAKKIGTSIVYKINAINKPIAIFLDKTVSCLETMFGVLYSGNYYTVLDTKSPKERLNLILNTLEPIIVITDNKNFQKAKDLGLDKELYLYEDILISEVNNEKLKCIHNKIIDTDPMYVLFTSGSTGVPKGTVVSHRAVTTYTRWVVDTFKITEKTIWGSQTPFYFSMSVTDVFSTVMSGATFYIIPKMFFSFPIKLIDFLNENKINTIYWVPSALCIVANFKTLNDTIPYTLEKVMFAGEVMPTKQLNMWIEKLPNVMFANLFGPTETTDICTYYIVNRKFENIENLPIGTVCNNCDVLVIKEDGIEATKGEEGELCVRGSFLASGYYNNPEKTAFAFVQNPLNKCYPEIIYKTGDMVKYNDKDELVYLSRKDFQIKHMGYRIELGEIETVINNIDEIVSCACVYNEESAEIVLFYQSDNLEEERLINIAKEKLLSYMCPNKIIKLNGIPHNANGKIDRAKLKEISKGE